MKQSLRDRIQLCWTRGIFCWVLCVCCRTGSCFWLLSMAKFALLAGIGCQNASKQLRLQILREHRQRPASIVEGHSLFSRGEPVWTSATAERALCELAAGGYVSQPLTSPASKVALCVDLRIPRFNFTVQNTVNLSQDSPWKNSITSSYQNNSILSIKESA